MPLMLGACSAAPLVDPELSCGAHSVRALSGPRLDPMGPVPACALPTVHDVASACAVDWTRVGEVRCAFSNVSHSRASCAFDLVGDASPAPSRRVEARFVHRYGEAVGEPDASGYGTYWQRQGPCR